MAERALHHGLNAGAAVLLQQMLFHGTGIDAHPDDAAVGLGGIHHAIHMLAGPDVAGIDAQALQSGFQGSQRQTVVEMDVRDEGHGRTVTQGPQGLGRRHVGHGHAHRFATAAHKAVDLGQRGFHVTGIGIGHALHHHRRAAADGQLTQPDAPADTFFLHGRPRKNWFATKVPPVSYAISAGKPSPVGAGNMAAPLPASRTPNHAARRGRLSISSAAHAAFRCRRTCQPYGFCL